MSVRRCISLLLQPGKCNHCCNAIYCLALAAHRHQHLSMAILGNPSHSWPEFVHFVTRPDCWDIRLGFVIAPSLGHGGRICQQLHPVLGEQSPRAQSFQQNLLPCTGCFFDGCFLSRLLLHQASPLQLPFLPLLRGPCEGLQNQNGLC